MWKTSWRFFKIVKVEQGCSDSTAKDASRENEVNMEKSYLYIPVSFNVILNSQNTDFNYVSIYLDE